MAMEKALEHTAKALAGLGPKDGGPSKAFQTLIRQIGEAKTKHEEDRIIRKEAVVLKERVGARDTTPRQMREYLIRLIYCEMLGLECSWGYIHAVKFTQNTTTLDKRIGYLAASLFLHENHELNMLLVNTLQRDLKSSNMLEVSMALIIICKLIGSEMIPPLFPLVKEKLFHPKELVRKKAVMTMHHFYLLSPGSVSELEDDFRRALSDPDPGVMEAALILFHDLVKNDPLTYKDLVSSFTAILAQVIGRKLPLEFDYHGVPAPWIQMRLLRILAILGADDLKTSEQIYDVLENALASAECTSNVGQAITYECICTITSIYPNASLVEKAAHAIVRFVTAANNNWKYLGITALASLVQVDPKYAAEHQMVVIDCLDDPDDTLKRKTLDLLYKMTNPLNVTVITEKLIGYLRQTRDEYIRSDLVAKITQLAERFAPDNQWFIQTMNAVFELGGHLVRREVAHNLMRLIAEGTDDEETDSELRLDALSSYISLLDRPHLPDILVKIICWVVGEYTYVVQDMETEDVLEKITLLLHHRFADPDTHGWVVAAITKLVSYLGSMPDVVQSEIALHLTSTSTELQQRCTELLELSQDLSLMQTVLPLDSACEDLEVDSSLSFLDDFISEALANGASTYKPPHLRITAVPPKAAAVQQSSELVYKPYAPPSSSPTPFSHPLVPTISSSQEVSPTKGVELSVRQLGSSPSSPAPISSMGSGGSAQTASYSYNPGELPGSLAVKERKWGLEGYRKSAPPVVIPPSQPAEPYHTGQGGEEGAKLVSSHEREHQELPPQSDSVVALSLAEASVLHQSPEELRRKELARELFGGLTGRSRPPRIRPQQQKGAGGHGGGAGGSPRVAPRRLDKPVETDLLLDLADVDFSQPVSMPTYPPVNQPLSDVNLDPLAPTAPGLGGGGRGGLLANLEVRPAQQFPPTSTFKATTVPPTQPLPSAASTASGSTDLLGLFDSPLTSLTATADPATTTVAPPPSNVLAPQISTDISLLEPSSGAQVFVREPQDSLALTLFENPLGSAGIPREFGGYPVVPGWENKDLCHDASLRVTMTKVVKPDELVLVLFLTNQKQSGLSGVTLSMETPSNTKACTGDGKHDLGLQADVSGFGTITHVVTLVPTSPAVNMSFRGEISYKDSAATQRRLFFDASIYVSDLLRPLEMSTEDFGQKWGSLSYEKKLSLHCSVKKPSDFMEAMKKKFHFHPIQLIGKEGITAARFLPNTMCLVHGKVSAAHLDFWIRTPSSLLTESIAKHAQLVMK